MELPSNMKRAVIESILLVVIAVIIAGSVWLGMNLYLNSDTPQVAVTTGSMEPTYHGFYTASEHETPRIFDGDLLLVRGIPSSQIKAGDTIVFNSLTISTPIVHRVVAVRENSDGTFSFRTMGDNNPGLDSTAFSEDLGWIHQDDVHGVVIFRIPHIGWFSLQLQTFEGRLILIFGAGLILLFGFFEGDDKEKEEKKKKEKVEKAEEKFLEGIAVSEELQEFEIPEGDGYVLRGSEEKRWVDQILGYLQEFQTSLGPTLRSTEFWVSKKVIISAIIGFLILIIVFSSIFIALGPCAVSLSDVDGNTITSTVSLDYSQIRTNEITNETVENIEITSNTSIINLSDALSYSARSNHHSSNLSPTISLQDFFIAEGGEQNRILPLDGNIQAVWKNGVPLGLQVNYIWDSAQRLLSFNETLVTGDRVNITLLVERNEYLVDHATSRITFPNRTLTPGIELEVYYFKVTLFCYRINMAVSSRGPFNYIRAVELNVANNSHSNLATYRWTVVYGSMGTLKIRNAAILLPIHPSVAETFTITVQAYVDGPMGFLFPVPSKTFQVEYF